MKRLTLILFSLIAVFQGLRATTVNNDCLAFTLHSGFTCSVSGCNFETVPEDLVIPSSITYKDASYTVTEIFGNVFEGCTKLKKVTIPATITEIKGTTFVACTNLREVVLPASLRQIGEGAFRGCSSLTDIVLPESLVVIGDEAFQNCSSLEAIELPDNLGNLGKGVFAWCTSLKRVRLSPAMTGISPMMFGYDTALSEIELHDGLVGINESAFYHSGLTEISIPSTVVEIGANAFSGCENLGNLNLADGLLWIGSSAFEGCRALEAVNLPSTLGIIYDYAFSESGLKEIEIPEGVYQIGEGTFSGSSLSRIILPSRLTEISRYFARNCRRLFEIELPDRITSIGEDAFYGSGLYYVTLGSNVKKIESGAFSNPETRVYCTASTPPDARQLSFNTARSSLFVKEESVSAYRNSSVWKEFATIASLKSDEAECVTINQMFEDVVVYKGETRTLTATVYPITATPPELKWESSNPSVATVSDNGEVTGVSIGIAVITVTAPSDKSISCEVKVGERLEGISLRLGYMEKGGSKAVGGQTVTLPANVAGRYSVRIYPEPADAAMTWLADDIIWRVSDQEVAEVRYGGTVSGSESTYAYKINSLTLRKPGTAVLTARTSSGHEASFTVNVVNAEDMVWPTALALTAEKTTVEVGEQLQINAAFDPADASVQIVHWVAPDDKVATIDADGLLTAVGGGTIRILAYSYFPDLEDWIDITVEGGGNIGLESVALTDAGGDDAAEEWFTVGGVKIDAGRGIAAPGVYIVRRGARVEKRVIR